jgi:hypothetical protein
MGWFRNLWRIRGTVPVSVDADEPALISRVGDNLEAMGRVIEEEEADRIIFSEAYGDKAPGEVDTLAQFDEGEIRREDRNGARVLRYNLRLSEWAIFVLVIIGLQLSPFLWGLRDLPGTLIVVGLGGLLFLALVYRKWRTGIAEGLKGTFESQQ